MKPTPVQAPPPPRPHPLAWLWYAAAGGLCGGSAVGAVEALAILSTMRPTEYEALAYAWVAYGAAGVVFGFALGILLVPVGAATRMSAARGWCLGCGAIAAAFGTVVLCRALGVAPGSPAVSAIGVGFGGAALAGVWFGGHLLTKTPLRILLSPRGTAGLWGAGLVVSAMLSLSPAPGAEGTMAPHRTQPESFAEKPDVLLIVVSGLRADAIDDGSGTDLVATPALRAFAADAVVFEQAVAASSFPRASVASLLTSRPPSRHHASDGLLPDDVVTLAELLRDGGYATGGLPGTPELSATWGLDQGFDWYPFDPEHPLAASASAHRLVLYGLAARAWRRVDPTERVEHSHPPADTQLARARAFLDANQGDRAFLFVHLEEPQSPWFPDPPDGTAYRREVHPAPAAEDAPDLRRRYAVEVARVDSALGRFFAALRADGRYDDLLLVVTADQGLELLDHGGAWDGETLYDELVHVPLLVKLPGNARAGTRVAWQVRQVDLAPTLADLAGFPAAPGWEGATLFDDAFDDHVALQEPPEGRDETDPPFVAPTWADHPGSRDALLELEQGGVSLQGVRSGGRKLVQVLDTTGQGTRSRRRLPSLACYDLVHDPGETRDLTRDDPSCPAALAERLQLLGAGPIVPPSEPVPVEPEED